MSTTPIIVIVRGAPAPTEFNVRSGPGTTYDKPFKAKAGTQAVALLEVRVDDSKTGLNGKIYQWFKMKFPDGREGWMRDDLLDIQGDCSTFGYGIVKDRSYAFVLVRDETVVAPKPTPTPTPPVPEPAKPPVVTPPSNEQERIKRASFNITAAFEGGGYASYQNYDTGIVSYGRFQFTLAASSLFGVLDRYLKASSSATANELRSNYYQRVKDRDPNLRKDERFKTLLKDAANEPPMQEAQDFIATERYWNVVQELSVKPRNIRTPLGQALTFDMGINFGTRHGFLGKAEELLGVPSKSRAGENGITEQQLITKLAELRKESHDKQAVRDNLPGLRPRGDFWVDLCKRGDWQLQGDANGLVTVKSGKSVQVKNP
jgi:hypothetical protein